LSVYPADRDIVMTKFTCESFSAMQRFCCCLLPYYTYCKLVSVGRTLDIL